MKKYTILYLVLLFLVLFVTFSYKSPFHRVIQIKSATEIYIDFNNNMVADINELVILKNDFNLHNFLKLSDKLKLSFLAKEYANKTLLNKYVKLVNHSTFNDVILLDGSSYLKKLQDNGYLFDGTNKDKIVNIINLAKDYNLHVYNKLSQKYHKLDCNYVLDSPFIEVYEKNNLPKNALPCKFCLDNALKVAKTYPKDIEELYSPLYEDDYIELYVTDYTKHYYPSNKCLTTACKSLLQCIDSSKHSIDFAIYGIDGQQEITNALLSAQKRGVRVRWVYDTDTKGRTIYKDSLTFSKNIINNRKDIDYDKSVSSTKRRDAIMHNKFFIFDNEKVWTGSANISHTDLSGFNANSVMLIKSKEVADLFTNEFEKMYSGFFHLSKLPTKQNNVNIGNSTISVYFSPQDSIIYNSIIPLINSAEHYIYIPVFVLTHKDFQHSLIEAYKKGVEIRIIVDATSASTKYSAVSKLRNLGLDIKVENRPGKMHMKSIIIDDKYVVLGSMNFTKSGEFYNDENVVIVENSQMAKVFKDKFLYFWDSIPQVWANKNPSAESFDSINSCNDGVDNDFDGKIDATDEGCFVR